MNGFGFIEYKDAMDARDVVPGTCLPQTQPSSLGRAVAYAIVSCEPGGISPFFPFFSFFFLSIPSLSFVCLFVLELS